MKANAHIFYSKPTFAEGVARIFDFTGRLSRYNQPPERAQSPEFALLSDWHAIGDDLRHAILEFAKANDVVIVFDDYDASPEHASQSGEPSAIAGGAETACHVGR